MAKERKRSAAKPKQSTPKQPKPKKEKKPKEVSPEAHQRKLNASNRADLRNTRGKVRDVRQKKRGKLKTARSTCREEGAHIVDDARKGFASTLTAARTKRDLEVLRGRGLCRAKREAVLMEFDPRLAELGAHAFRLAGLLPARKPSRAAEKREEERDGVTYELEQRHPELLPIWRRDGKKLQARWRKLKPNKSLAEYVIEVAAENPEDVVAAQSRDARSWLGHEIAGRVAELARQPPGTLPPQPYSAPPSMLGLSWAAPVTPRYPTAQQARAVADSVRASGSVYTPPPSTQTAARAVYTPPSAPAFMRAPPSGSPSARPGRTLISAGNTERSPELVRSQRPEDLARVLRRSPGIPYDAVPASASPYSRAAPSRPAPSSSLRGDAWLPPSSVLPVSADYPPSMSQRPPF